MEKRQTKHRVFPFAGCGIACRINSRVNIILIESSSRKILTRKTDLAGSEVAKWKYCVCSNIVVSLHRVHGTQKCTHNKNNSMPWFTIGKKATVEKKIIWMIKQRIKSHPHASSKDAYDTKKDFFKLRETFSLNHELQYIDKNFRKLTPEKKLTNTRKLSALVSER